MSLWNKKMDSNGAGSAGATAVLSPGGGSSTAAAPVTQRWNPPAQRVDYAGRNAGIQAINEAVAQASAWVAPLRQQIGRVIVGQEHLIDRLLNGGQMRFDDRCDGRVVESYN